MRLPTSEPARRIAALFRRRLTTEWSEKEARQMRTLAKARYFETLDDLALVERYYAFERKKADKGVHRRDLCTFLNNFPGEVDRAKEWEELHFRPARKIIPGPFSRPEPNYVPPSDPAEVARFNAERLARKGRIL